MTGTFCSFTRNFTFVPCFDPLAKVGQSTIAYLCPNIIYFDAVDFTECRSEEVSSDAQCIILPHFYEFLDIGLSRSCVKSETNCF